MRVELDRVTVMVNVVGLTEGCMAIDHTVMWKDDRPTKWQVEGVLRNYLDGAVLSVKWDQDRFFVHLVGRKTFPFKGFGNPREEAELARFAEPHHERWFEVWLSFDKLCTITREADEYTNTVAAGIAATLARYWGGKVLEQ